MYCTPTQLKPRLRTSLEDFVAKYADDKEFKTQLEDLNFMIGLYNRGTYFNEVFPQEFVDHYAQTILPVQEFEFHINPENGNCHLSFPYQLNGRQLDIHLEGFHFTDRFNLATAEDVFNLICDFQLEVQRVRHDLEFKKY